MTKRKSYTLIGSMVVFFWAFLLSSDGLCSLIFDSRPTATAKLYLDFDGDSLKNILPFSNTADVPAILNGVSAAFDQFNLDITTVDPLVGSGLDWDTGFQTLAGRKAGRILIGNNSFGNPSGEGGAAAISGYTAQFTMNHTAYVYPSGLANNSWYEICAIVHEAGHMFGLRHQSARTNGALTAEYNPGNGMVGPWMGAAYGDKSGTWIVGLNDQNVLQDDVAIIASPTNGFGLVPEGNSPIIVLLALGSVFLLSRQQRSFCAVKPFAEKSVADFGA